MDYPYAGQVEIFPHTYAPRGYAPCEGQLLNIGANIGLYSVIGAAFGGDGKSTFALPDFAGRAPAGSMYYIALNGAPPNDNSQGKFYTGEITLFASDNLPTGWAPCNGLVLIISQFEALYQVIGTKFGSMGYDSFALPNYTNAGPDGLRYCIVLSGNTP